MYMPISVVESKLHTSDEKAHNVANMRRHN